MLNFKNLQHGELPRGPEGLVAWVVLAKCGETISYYRGSLCNDRGILSTNRSSTISAAADVILAACEAGFINILQMRRGDSDYVYIAKRTDVEFKKDKLTECMSEIKNRRKESVKNERARERDAARKRARKQMETEEGDMA
jgi:hypothetical protein